MTDGAHVLVVDDEPSILKFVRSYLVARGYRVTTASDGLEALEILGSQKVDLVILDLMLPRLDGVEVCRSVRSWSQVPIVVLSARDQEDDKVEALDLGADDYLTKPFGTKELLARVRAVLRRQEREQSNGPSVSPGDLTIDLRQHRAQVCGRDIQLTRTEYKLLRELALNAGKVLTHADLLQRVWGPDYEGESQYLHVFIGRLRRKLDPPGSPHSHIVTIPAVGYQLDDQPRADASPQVDRANV